MHSYINVTSEVEFSRVESCPSTAEFFLTPIAGHLYSTSGNTVSCDCMVCKMIGPVPTPKPGKFWIPTWTLQNEEKVLDKMKGPQEKAVLKRKKMYCKTKLIASNFDELKMMERSKRIKSVTKKMSKKINFDNDSKKDGDNDDYQDVDDGDNTDLMESSVLSEVEEETKEECVEEESDDDGKKEDGY